MSVIYSGDNITFDDGSTLSTGHTHFRNRIINGDMRIAQRTTSVQTANTAAGDVFPVDRINVFCGNPYSGAFSVQQSTDVPTGQGFANSVIITTSTADSSLTANELAAFRQIIEAYNIADLNWGTADAKAVSLSFWAKSSIAGTHSGTITNGGWSRTYGFTYTLSNANTWQYVTIENIPGPTTGDWGGNSTGRGIQIVYNLGAHSGNLISSGAWTTTSGVTVGVTGSVQLVSTLNANLYVTGIQFERGSKATTFERRPYGLELALCQRYCATFVADGGIDNYAPLAIGRWFEGQNAQFFFTMPTTMRFPPTLDAVSTTPVGTFAVNTGGSFNAVVITSMALNERSHSTATLTVGYSPGGQTVGQATTLYCDNADFARITFTAEL